MKTSNVFNGLSFQLKKKTRIASMLLLSVFTVAGFSSCEDEDDPIVDTINQQDSDFALAASQSINGQIALGNLALSKGLDDSVIDYANMIVDDHTAAKAEFEGIVQGREIEISKEISADIQAEITALEGLEGEDFDRAFINSQLNVNNNLKSSLQNQIDNGENYLIKSFADKILDVVDEHDRKALLVKAELEIENL